jgi:MarR family transcriptional regulator for hemolysin
MSLSLEKPHFSQAPSGARQRSIGLKLAVLARQMRQGFDERVEAAGVTRAKWVLIAAVATNPGVSQREVAAKLNVSDVTACRLIDRVCSDGLMERHEHPQDRRAYQLSLTPAAQPLLEALSRTADLYEVEIFAGLDETDIDLLDALLRRLALNLANAPDVGAPPLENGAVVFDGLEDGE